MLDATIKSQLGAYLGHLRHPIELVLSTDDSQAGQEIRALAKDITDLSDKVSIREADSPRKPSFGIARVGEEPRVRFAAVPMGHEFTSLVLALLHVGGHPPKFSADELKRVEMLRGPLHFEVFMSLSCHNCPDVVQALNTMAALNPAVRSDTMDGALFQAEVEARGVMAVPAVFLNGQFFASGRMELVDVLEKLGAFDDADEAQTISEQAPFDVLVVGGGPAGVASAVYAARKGIRTGILAERMGGQVNDTPGIENYISVLETQGPRFSRDLRAHVEHYGVTIVERQRAARLVPGKEPGAMAQLYLENGAVLEARSVILATGARWRNLNVPGEAEYKNKGVAYCPHCDGPLFRGKRVAVVGGGNSGVEAAIDLAGLVSHVTVLEVNDQLKADAVLLSKLKSLPNVSILTHAQTLEVVGNGQKVMGLRYQNRVEGSEHLLELEGVFVQIGLVPNTEWLGDAVERNRFGEIVVDAKGYTSAPGVFAAGDCTSVPYKQIVVAAGEGAKAALSAFDYLIRIPQMA